MSWSKALKNLFHSCYKYVVILNKIRDPLAFYGEKKLLPILRTSLLLSGTKFRVLHNLADRRIEIYLYSQCALVQKKKVMIFIFYSNWPKCGVNCLFLRRMIVSQWKPGI